MSWCRMVMYKVELHRRRCRGTIEVLGEGRETAFLCKAWLCIGTWEDAATIDVLV